MDNDHSFSSAQLPSPAIACAFPSEYVKACLTNVSSKYVQDVEGCMLLHCCSFLSGLYHANSCFDSAAKGHVIFMGLLSASLSFGNYESMFFGSFWMTMNIQLLVKDLRCFYSGEESSR